MPLAPDTAAEPQPVAPLPWTWAQRVGFRFAFVFFGAYTVGLYTEYFQIGGFGKYVWNKPQPPYLYHYLVQLPARWIGARVLHMCPLVPVRGGFGERDFYCWVNVGIWLLILSALVAAAWTVVDRDRPHYRRLLEWLRTAMRYFLAFVMWQYATGKFNGTQFASGLASEELLNNLGNLTPQRLMWGTMGESDVYSIFTGVGEAMGGILLFWRRTTSLGALIIVVVMANVFLLDIVHQVAISERAFFYLLMAIFLLLPELRRLWALYVSNEPVPPVPSGESLMKRPAWLPCHAVTALKMLAVAGMLLRPFFLFPGHLPFVFLLRPKPPHPFSGAYAVEEFVRNGRTIAPRYDDSTRWVNVAIPGGATRALDKPPENILFITATGASERFAVKFDSVKSTFALTERVERHLTVPGTTRDSSANDEKPAGTLEYAWMGAGRLQLQGTVKQDTVRALLQKMNDNDALLRGGAKR